MLYHPLICRYQFLLQGVSKNLHWKQGHFQQQASAAVHRTKKKIAENKLIKNRLIVVPNKRYFQFQVNGEPHLINIEI